MTPQNALNRIKADTPMKQVANKWQYQTELQVLQDLIDKHEQLLKGLQALSALDQLNVKVLLRANEQEKQSN